MGQALAAAMRIYLDEWYVMVNRLDFLLRQEQLSMQMLVFHCQEPMAMLRLLATIAAEASSRNLSSAGTSCSFTYQQIPPNVHVACTHVNCSHGLE